MLRILLAALALCLAAGAAVAQNPLEPSPTPATPPAANAQPAPKAEPASKAEPAAKAETAAKKAASSKKPAKAKVNARPAWAELTAEHQQILAPLKADWDALEPERRQKWLAIAKRYPKMKVEEQERVQRRMQAWANLTPEQRRQARENYKHLAKTPREKRDKNLREAWAEYQALPPSERQNLAPPPSPESKRPKH
jgi:hypothetical protein